MAYMGGESRRHREEGDNLSKRKKGQHRCPNEQRAAAGTCGLRLAHRTSVHHCHLHGLRGRGKWYTGGVAGATLAVGESRWAERAPRCRDDVSTGEATLLYHAYHTTVSGRARTCCGSDRNGLVRNPSTSSPVVTRSDDSTSLLCPLLQPLRHFLGLSPEAIKMDSENCESRRGLWELPQVSHLYS